MKTLSTSSGLLVLLIALTSYQLQSCLATPDSNFKTDPAGFMKENLITTWYSSKLIDKDACGALTNTKTPAKFSLVQLTDKKGFSIYPKTGGGIEAFWLAAKTMITIPRIKTIVLTPELNGGSLYIRVNEKDKTLSIYHHRGEPKVPAKKDSKYVVKVSGKDETFDDVLSPEKYGTDTKFTVADAPSCAKPGTDVKQFVGVHLTAFVSVDPTGEVSFLWQKFKNSLPIATDTEPKNFEKLTSEKTVANVPGVIAKPAPAVIAPGKTNSDASKSGAAADSSKTAAGASGSSKTGAAADTSKPGGGSGSPKTGSAADASKPSGTSGSSKTSSGSTGGGTGGGASSGGSNLPQKPPPAVVKP